MTRDNRDRLGMFAGAEVEVRRLALNIDQFRQFNLSERAGAAPPGRRQKSHPPRPPEIACHSADLPEPCTSKSTDGHDEAGRDGSASRALRTQRDHGLVDRLDRRGNGDG